MERIINAMYYDDIKYQREVIGFLIRKTRLEKDLTLDALSNVLSKSKQFLYEVEIGNKGNDEFVQVVFRYLGVDFNFDLEIGKEILQDFDLSIHHYVGMNRKGREEYWEKILKQKEYQNTFFYPIISLVRFIDSLMSDEEIDIEFKFEECEKVYPLFSRYQKAVFWYFKGMYLKNVLSEEDSILCFEKSLENSSSSEISAMAFYLLSHIYENEHNFITAINYAEKSKILLNKYNNLHRLIYPQIVIANIFSRMRKTTDMEREYLIAEEISNQFGDEINWILIIQNLGVSFLNCNEYSKAINYSMQIVEKKCNKKIVYYILAWSYYKLDQRKESANYLSELQKVNDYSDVEINTYECCLKYLLNSKEQESYKRMLKYYESLEDKKLYTEKIIVLERMIEYCDKHELINEGYKYQKELIKILKIH